ncbi:MAG TPA: radical SAM protein [Candidatus Deferrimicrobium sp.]|nr:radical SAM protein [Candidatus Deferrimicrobium sp.]
MKVTFVNPNYEEPRVLKFLGLPSIPLGFSIVAGCVEKAGHEVTVIDAFGYKYSVAQTIAELKKTKPEITAISCVTCNVDLGIKIAQAARTFSRVVIGGTHPSLMPESVIDYADIVVYGEGEETFPDILSGKKLADIPGVMYKSDGKIMKTSPRPPIKDLDTLPFPARHLFPMHKYKQFGTMLLATMLTSRGCPHRCSYCTISRLYPQWRGRSAENVTSEMEFLVKNYKVKGISIVDEDFLVESQRAYDICDGIEKKNIKVWWGMQTRVDRIPEVDTLKRFNAAGCEFVLFGVESSRERTMKNLNRDIPNHKFIEAVKKCREAGMRVAVSALLGFPGENEEDILNTIKFVLELGPEYVFYGVPTPFPGTDFYRYCRDNDLIKEKNLLKYTIMSPIIETGDISLKQSRKLLNKAYRQFYFRPVYLSKRMVYELRKLDKDTLKGFIRWSLGGFLDSRQW